MIHILCRKELFSLSNLKLSKLCVDVIYRDKYVSIMKEGSNRISFNDWIKKIHVPWSYYRVFHFGFFGPVIREYINPLNDMNGSNCTQCGHYSNRGFFSSTVGAFPDIGPNEIRKLNFYCSLGCVYLSITKWNHDRFVSPHNLLNKEQRKKDDTDTM